MLTSNRKSNGQFFFACDTNSAKYHVTSPELRKFTKYRSSVHKNAGDEDSMAACVEERHLAAGSRAN
jgi:hypothetical protein